MAPITVDPQKVREFVDEQSFYDWLAKHHDIQDELWIKLHKVGSGLASITPKQAIDVVLCWGWIDAVRKGFDDKSYLQRYTRRGRKSIWSQINVDNVARLTKSGRMTEHGLKHVDAAKADGRWDRAYGSGKDMKIPDDLQGTADALGKLIRTLQDRGDVSAEQMPLLAPYRLDDCGWVANRWCELLPLPLLLKQRLMELDNPLVRLELVSDVLARTGIAG